jgi:predicted secreted Zn-dependent protease
MWKYPTTPIENFQDAKFRYKAQTDPEIKVAFDELEKAINEHLERHGENK